MNTELFGPTALINKAQKSILDDAKEVTTSAFGLRPGTTLPVVKNYFVFAGAGMGDFICYMPAMVWIARNCPWIEGGIYCPEFFIEFAENIMRPYGWRAFDAAKIKETLPRGVVLTGPGVAIEGKKNVQLLNGTGGHLVDVGHAMMVNRLPTSDFDRMYPQIRFSEEWLAPTEAKFRTFLGLPERGQYVVLTPGGVSDNRTVPGEYWNPIIDHIKELGLTPVFLGRSQMSKHLRVSFPDGCRYQDGLDLRDKTTMLEAAWIMQDAACVLGHDNGLIHLAGCTDAAIIASYGSVHPRERRVFRKHGKWIELFPESLPCAGCQTHVKKLRFHSFKYCIYKKKNENGEDVQDLQCIDELFSNEASQWKLAIDCMVDGKGKMSGDEWSRFASQKYGFELFGGE